MNSFDQITIHCSATPNSRPVSVDEIRSWHLARGFHDIGYHFVILADGTISVGRPLPQEGAHVEGHNAGNIGICLVGLDSFLDKQWGSLRVLLDDLISKYGIKLWEIHGHYEFDTARAQGKTCPNVSMERILDWYLTGNNEAIAANLIKS